MDPSGARTPAAAARDRARPAAAPPPRRLLALLDYDGTLTTRECNEVVLQRFTGDAWRTPERLVADGTISHGECFRRQIALFTQPRDEVVAAMLEQAEPVTGLRSFLRRLVDGGDRAAVISVGIRDVIEGFWRREDLPACAIYASDLLGDPASGYDARLSPLLGDCPRCGPGGCKGGAVRALREVGEAVAVFGDGLSDLCMAREADVVFAHGSLQDHCTAAGIAWQPLIDFDDAWRRLLVWRTESDDRGRP